ncbi:MAG TPA: type I 3-dehydroquinate dehydratase [Bacillota bacterium]|nr:type I 3-dehydroquinate dehydratase [Bacillota bacterium]
MRLQAKKPIKIRGKVLGGAEPLICMPLAEEEEKELMRAAEDIAEFLPDAIEWRADYFKDACDPIKVKRVLMALRRIIGETPLIFTFRSNSEGGFNKVEDPIRYEIIKQAIYTGEADAVDIELASGKTNIAQIKEIADKHHVILILSYHNFAETPPIDYLIDKIKEQISSGANVPKIAVMPKTEEDVLTLLSATLKARMEIDTPIITMSMGKLGMISRVAGGIFGSDLTFGASKKASAPGQIPINDLKTAMNILFC